MLFVFAENPEVVDSQLLTCCILFRGMFDQSSSCNTEAPRKPVHLKVFLNGFFSSPKTDFRLSGTWDFHSEMKRLNHLSTFPENQWLEDDISFWDGLFSRVMPVSESVTLSILGFHVSFEGCKCLLNLRLCLVSISAFFHTFLFTGPLPGWLDEVKRMELWKMRAKLERGEKRRLYHD